MRWLIRSIQARLGIYYTNQEYWVKIDDIIIPDKIKQSKIGEWRYKRETNYWKTTKLFATRVLLDRNFSMLDGYITYLIALENKEELIPVNFIDTYKRDSKNED